MSTKMVLPLSMISCCTDRLLCSSHIFFFFCVSFCLLLIGLWEMSRKEAMFLLEYFVCNTFVEIHFIVLFYLHRMGCGSICFLWHFICFLLRVSLVPWFLAHVLMMFCPMQLSWFFFICNVFLLHSWFSCFVYIVFLAYRLYSAFSVNSC